MLNEETLKYFTKELFMEKLYLFLFRYSQLLDKWSLEPL